MSEPEIATPAGGTRKLWAIIPFAATALVAIAISIMFQQLLGGQLGPAAPTPSSPVLSAQPTTQPSAPPSASPTDTAALPRATVLPPDERVLQQELIDLRDQGERRAGFVYLLKAESLLRLAEEALVQNNMSEVDRTLLDVDVTFSRAYERSADAARSPILQLREQLSLIHDDLYVRPEGIDQRLRRLRQSTLSLVDEVP